MKFKYIAGIIIALILITGIAAASRNHAKSKMTMPTSATTMGSSVAVATNSVQIANYAFGPAAISVKVGTTVTWTNGDNVRHTVTADHAMDSAPNSSLFGRGETYSFTFKTAGTYTYHCMPHSYMHGSVTVTN